jgi:hypothetical protein
VLAESPAVTQFAAKSPEILVAGLLVAFAFVVALFSIAAGTSPFSSN